jgi:NADH dehydrogenase/NADH:ubiquinone oxidoreductase subunit G
VSAPERVKVTIDGRDVLVARGTGLVEAALAAGIEIPVFCYEPRLGPPVGACRMCLCEVEGMPPKPQAACTLTAQDGMVVKTAQTSKLAADAQNATLEFILVNHPLDCPVCDKGGECPLQDLTFRYGPGRTRMTFPKRTFDKPIPISPTIALDRERCILCYRCTRFSEDIAEDGQLIAKNRGAQSTIATFQDEPYRAPFSGNVIELCPVGALTSTQYRFEARPWEIQNVPTVCGLCPVGCNISATTREGNVKRIVSRNHPEVDEGWLCDKGRFAFSHLGAKDRIADPLRKVGLHRLEPISWDDALADVERMLRNAGSRIVTALSGSESIEQAYALGKLLRQGLGAHSAVLPEELPEALDAYRLPLSSIRDAETIVVLGDEPVVERAPVVDLWIKAARRNGAQVVTEIPETPGPRTIVVGCDPEEVAWQAQQLGAWGAFYLPATPNGRGVSDAWSAAADSEATELESVSLLIVSGDEAAANPDVRAMAEHADAVIAIGMFSEPLRGWVDLVLPATSYLEREGTTVNLEGRLQRQRRTVIPPVPDELAWISKLAERFGVTVSPYAPAVFEEFSGMAFADVGDLGLLPPKKDGLVAEQPRSARRQRGTRLVTYKPLFSGPAVERIAELQFQRPEPEIELAAADARKQGIATGDTVRVGRNGTSVELRARVSGSLRAGTARVAREHAGGLGDMVEVTKP